MARLDQGGYAELAVAKAEGTTAIPEGVSYEQAASLPVAYLTAWVALFETVKLQPGETVLVQAVSAGVGTAGVQIAKHVGKAGILFTTAGTDERAKRGLELGADFATTYDDFVETVMQHTNGRGVDVALEMVGGQVFKDSQRALAEGGRLVSVGRSSGQQPEVDTALAEQEAPGGHRRLEPRARPQRAGPDEGPPEGAGAGEGRDAAGRHRPRLPLKRGGGGAPSPRAPRAVRQGAASALRRSDEQRRSLRPDNAPGGHPLALPAQRERDHAARPRSGLRGAGRPCILLVHGFPELAYSWRKVMLPLAAAGYHVVAPDQRGYGRSDGTDAAFEDELWSFTLLNKVRDTMALVFALGHRSVEMIVGHDYGSAVAAWSALTRPDVFRSVVLMSAPFEGSPALCRAAAGR